MNRVECLMQYATDRDIYVHPHTVAGTLAMAFEAAGESAIAIDLARIETRAEQAVIMAHELGHIETGTLHNADDRYMPEGKTEYKAFKWSVAKLLPRSKLECAIRRCQGRLWEVAEELCLTQEFIERAIGYYKTQA